jgi:Protein of unknown function (DUF1302)
MKRVFALLGLLMIAAAPLQAEVELDGFLQGLYGGRVDRDNPTETEFTASETRMQLRAQSWGDNAEFFGRLDFVYDAAVEREYDWELREGFVKFRLGDNIDFKVGRQILTWGTGDLIFINDVFAKDYRSFFVGRDDQYLKAPQNALRMEWYNPLGALSFVWTPRLEPNRLPAGERLSYFSPFDYQVVGTGMGDQYLFAVPEPEARFKNGEFAFRLSRSVMGFSTALYYYHGFYKNPQGLDQVAADTNGMPIYMPVFPRLDVYGASTRGTLWGGILWLEGGYFDSRESDQSPITNPRPPSMITGMIGYERQVASNLTANVQWQYQQMQDDGVFLQIKDGGATVEVREDRHLLTTRLRKLLLDENLTLSSFVFYSPTDEDVFAKMYASYKYSDELTLAVGANIFAGTYDNTDFGQFQKNDNAWLKVTYGF